MKDNLNKFKKFTFGKNNTIGLWYEDNNIERHGIIKTKNKFNRIKIFNRNKNGLYSIHYYGINLLKKDV